MEEFIEKFDYLEKLIQQQGLLQKEVLNVNEAASYMGVSKSWIYSMTSKRKLPHYCPQGKLIFFRRQELNDWLLKNRNSTMDEIEHQAIDSLGKKPERR